MSRLRFSRRAELDLVDIGAWIAADRPFAARKMVNRLIERASALREHPEMGALYPVYGADIRALAVRPYLVLYRVSGEHVFIERVVHSARLPKHIA